MGGELRGHSVGHSITQLERSVVFLKDGRELGFERKEWDCRRTRLVSFRGTFEL